MVAARPAFGQVRFYLYHRYRDLGANGLRASDLLRYGDELAAVCARVFARAGSDEWLEIVVALRRRHAPRIWFLSERPREDVLLAGLRRDLQACAAPAVRAGTIVLGLSGAAGDAQPRWRGRDDAVFPWPPEWPEAPDDWRAFHDLLDTIWSPGTPRLREAVAVEDLTEAS